LRAADKGLIHFAEGDIIYIGEEIYWTAAKKRD
jgi:hypothetical protein